MRPRRGALPWRPQWSLSGAGPCSPRTTWCCSTPGPGGSTGANPFIFGHLPMRIAILDPAAGISGDMTLGALLALGVPPAWLEELPRRLYLAGVALGIRGLRRAGAGGEQSGVSIPEQPHMRHVF